MSSQDGSQGIRKQIESAVESLCDEWLKDVRFPPR